MNHFLQPLFVFTKYHYYSLPWGERDLRMQSAITLPVSPCNFFPVSAVLFPPEQESTPGLMFHSVFPVQGEETHGTVYVFYSWLFNGLRGKIYGNTYIVS
jgi:hypothetical protein